MFNEINYNNYITASGKYPERLKNTELNQKVIDNSKILLKKVNALLLELGLENRVFDISSGFRPSSVNKATAGSAKKSLHMLGMAIDIVDDKKQTLAKLIMSRPDLLKKHGLWLEHPNSTIGKNTNWVHLDMDSTIRKDRPSRVFIPA